MSDPQLQEMPTEALVALRSGRKIEAIRIVREQMGMGLAEAKDLVDRAAAAHAPEPPRKVASREDRGGLRLIAVLAALAAVVALFLL